MSPPNPLLVDTSVLIDYHKSKLAVLTLASKHIGKVNIPREVLKEVGIKAILSDRDCERHGLKIIDSPPLEQLQRVSLEGGSLSPADVLCLFVAKKNCCICVTNDKALRKACEREKVATMRGLRLMITLVEKKQLPADDAISIAKKIGEHNPSIRVRLNKFISAVKACHGSVPSTTT